jgi:hypothetical protein
LTSALSAATAVAADFTINFRALGGADNPHPPIPQCQVVEEDDPPYPDSTGDCLHGLATSNGQPIECLLAGVESCPALTIGVPSPGVMFATTSGLGILDYDTQDPLACPLHCSSNWLIGDNCGTTPGDPCFCDINGCVGTPSLSEDWKDGLDYTYDDGPSGEEYRIYFGVPTLLSDLAFWRAGFSELDIQRNDCPAPARINFREGENGASNGDGVFTFPGGGLYLPANAVVTISNPGFRPFSTNDRIAIQELGVTMVNPQHQEPWRIGCPYFAVPFDHGFTDITNAEWTRTDDDTSPPTDTWTSTDLGPVTYCGLANLTGGAGGAACFQSRPGLAGFDTSLISRAFDLSAAAHPNLHFVVHLQRDDEILQVLTSTDGGTTWDLRLTLDTDLGQMPGPGGDAIELPLPDLAFEPAVQLRSRYSDPASTDSADDHAVIDDILMYSYEAPLFADGFESGSTAAWQ